MTSHKTFYDFLKFCLSNDAEEVPSCVATIDWMELLSFAKKQSIEGIYAYTILDDNEKLIACNWYGNKPDAVCVIKWTTAKVNINKKNKYLNEFCVKTVAGFIKGGFRSCILKGQGNTLFYKNPNIRCPGDIDIWLDGDRWTIFKFIRNIFPKAKFKCQHIECPIWPDIAVEVHFFPMYLENFFYNRILQRFFSEQQEFQFNHNVILPGTKDNICIPTTFFNAIYQLTHINVHILIEGIGLRQFIDYFYVLKNLTEEEQLQAAKLIKQMHLQHLAASVMYIENTVLGLSEKHLIVSPDEKRGLHLLKEIERGGNFGKHDINKNKREKFWHLQIRKIMRDFHFIFDFPSEECSEPIFRIVHFIWRQWYQLKWMIYKMINKLK